MPELTRTSRRFVAVVLVALAGVLTAAAAAEAAVAPTPKALINGATVSGGATSLEARIAVAGGFEVTIVSDTTWASMTAAQFGEYQVLIAGDPTCAYLPSGLVTSAPVYGPVVMGDAGGRTSAGNRVVVGTDPVYHAAGSYTGPNARGTIIREGIAFAGKQPGRTGMYFSASCDSRATTTVPILEALSEGTGAWSINGAAPCGGTVSLIADNPSFADLTTASLQGWQCSVHETFPTFRSDWSALAIATDTTSKPTCGVDRSTMAAVCGQAYVLIAGSGIILLSGSIAVTPDDSSSRAGRDHTVTASVTSGGDPLAGQVVDFSVTGQNGGATGTCMPVGCVSDASGNVAFTYTGTNGAGEDTIKASFRDAAGALQAATAQQEWTVNGAPVLATTPSSLGYTENDPGTAFDSGITATDADDTSLESGRVAFASGFEPGDQMVFADQNGIAGSYNSGTGVLTLSGIATVAEYQAALRSIEYRHTGENPSTTKSVEFGVNDGEADSNTPIRDIAVTTVDDSPTAVDDAKTVDQDSGATGIDVLANDTDVDAGSKTVSSMTQPANGSLEVTNADTRVFYRPNAGYCNSGEGAASDTFTYKLNGGSQATVAVRVECAARAPASDTPAPASQPEPTAPADGRQPRTKLLIISHRNVITNKRGALVRLRCKGVSRTRCVGSAHLQPTSLSSRLQPAGVQRTLTTFGMSGGRDGNVRIALPAASKERLAAKGKAVARVIVRLENGSTVKRLVTLYPPR